MSRHAIVLGAGVIGLSTAYHLARKSYGKITVIEKGRVGDGASSRAAGIITGLLWSETGVRARNISLTRFRELSEELEGYKFQNVGCLNLFDAESWPEREQLLPMYDRLHAEYTVMEAAEINNFWPDLSIPDGTVGLFDPCGGYSEPDHYLPALKAGCRDLGVNIIEECMISDFIEESGTMAGVVVENEPIKADAVVSTVHAWTLRVLELIGLKLPLKTFVHQRYVTETLTAPLDIPVVNANPFGGYFRPAHGQRLLVGIENPAAPEFCVPDRSFEMSSILPPPGLNNVARTDLLPLVPVADRSKWEIEKAGLLSFSLDGEPIVGPVERFPGLYVGVAFHSGGFAYNPAAGVLLASCIADGSAVIDIQDFSPNRFEPKHVEAYNRTLINHGEYSMSGENRRH